METFARARLALMLGATLALLAGCGGLQPSIGVPVESQAGIAARHVAHRAPAPMYRVLYSFKRRADGTHPGSGLVSVNGILYGTTTAGGRCAGTVYSVTTGGSEDVLHCFGHGDDGRSPQAELIDVNGVLYGTTYGGGKFRKGTVFSVSTSGAEKVLHSFKGGSDGANPNAALVNVNGTLYGTTAYGGSACGSFGCGTVYAISTTGSESVLHSFQGGSEGAYLPEAALLYMKGRLYGTTYLGGSTRCLYHHGCGVVFTLTMAGKEKLLFRFSSFDGSHPFAGLIDVKGVLYGTNTAGGGPSYSGTVYAVRTDGVAKVVHRFRPPGGYGPQTELIHVNGTFYGTTTSGGSHGDNGTIFSMSSAGATKVLHNFAGGSDGSYPQSALIDVNGTLYGTTYYGGVDGECCGTVFALTP